MEGDSTPSATTGDTMSNQDTITTLIVKHAPTAIAGTADKAIAYFKQYQAAAVRPMQGVAMRGTVFLDFADPAAAARAYSQLQQLNQYGNEYKKIRVEYARPNPARVNSNNNQKDQATAIAPHLGVHYPANPQLRYRYPDPTPEILNNIMHAITTVPRLYVQTLHLMNKMNLTPPFGPLSSESIPQMTTTVSKRKHDDLVDSDESELESDPEEKQKELEKQAVKSRIMAAANERKKRLYLQQRPSKKNVTSPVVD